MLSPLFWIVASFLPPVAPPAAQTCTDIRTFDFKDAIVHLSSQDENEAKGLFNAPYPNSFWFRLHNGTGSISPDGGVTQEWHEELLDDRTVHPEPSLWLRVLVLEHRHLLGSGTWRYILILRCEDHLLTPVFQFNAEGVRLEHLDDSGFKLSQTLWTPTDPHSHPSKHRDLFYRWSPRQHRYLRTEEPPIPAS
ncbi:MAG TPA: hypothetical protein VL495_01760 [Edaphobacter sp.]|jgi:hypothetical protein|nr:hypothetical protein [Edaphobacter sp.]